MASPSQFSGFRAVRGTAESRFSGHKDKRLLVAKRDEAVLAQFGKKQQLKRRFGLLSIVGLTCNLMITWEGMLIVLAEGLNNGGPLGSITSFIFVWMGTISQALIMAELGSMIPVSGGQYNWVAILAPPSWSRFLSYITGWITAIAWQSIVASGVYLVGTFVQGLAVLNWPLYTPTNWQTTLMFFAVIFVSLIFNTLLARLLPQLESAQLLVHILGFFAILIPLAYLGPKTSAQFVFQTFLSEGGWSTRGLTFFVGINNTMLSFLGIDGATHLAEEIEDAANVIPKAIIMAAILSGVTGLAIIITAFFSIVNINDVLTTPTGYPLLEIFRESVGSTSGATGMAVVIGTVLTLTTIGSLAAASRMLWAFSRERAVPLHRWISKVDRRTSLPLVSIGVSVLLNILLSLINIGSTAAFNAFTSLAVSAFYTAYIISAVVLLKCKFSNQPLKYGPFQLGRYGIPVGIFSVIYSVIGAFFSFWPQSAQPTLQDMNWASVMFVGVLALSLVYWVVRARKTYTGPIIEITPEELMIQQQI